MKQGQFEIMGLAIIVVIISVAIFFFLTFSLEPEPDISRQFQQEQFMQNAVTAWLSTSIQGCDDDVKGYVVRYTTNSLFENNRCDSEALMEELANELERAIQPYLRVPYYNLSIRYGVCDTPSRVEGCEQRYTTGNCDPSAPGAITPRAGREVLPLSPIPGNAEVVLFGCAG